MNRTRIYIVCIAFALIATTLHAKVYWPTSAVVGAEVPTKVRVLSINNSLIDYNDQYAMFNDIASAMSKDATWTKHTNLGKTLAYHFNEDPLNPNAKEVVAGTAWTHIILQEQSSLPRTNLETFRSNVQTWVNYIRTNCPNPNVVIILPINWPYNNDTDYQAAASIFMANYRTVADEFGLVLCPCALAYAHMQAEHPESFSADLYTDDRHPTQAATYMACCLEYAVIFGVDPSTITWKPGALAADKASTMRSYAKTAYENTSMVVTVPEKPVADPTPADTITGTDTYTQNFNALGGEDVTPVADSDGKTAYSRETTLPTGWRIERNMSAPRTIGSFASASEKTMYIGGTSLASNDKNGTWNFGATGSTDRALGGLTTGIDGGTRGLNIMVHLYNNSGRDFEKIELEYDIEKYRNGSNAAGFTVQLYTSRNGVDWTSAGDTFCQKYAADANSNGFATVPADVKQKSGTLNEAWNKNSDLYLTWNISVSSGTSCNAAPALAIDNVVITPIVKADGTDIQKRENSQGEWKKVVCDGRLLIVNDNNIFDIMGTRVR